MKPRLLLVNPPIYDFSAYDFWLKPYGLLRAAGMLRGQGDVLLFDYLDRLHPLMPRPGRAESDQWGRGKFYAVPAPKPSIFAIIQRRYRRFGLPRAALQEFLSTQAPFDAALVQTGMTYWYPGVREVIEDIRKFAPATKIVLGGTYATLCSQHARELGADLVIEGAALAPLGRLLNVRPDADAPAFWEAYDRLDTGVLKLSDGCPFHCTYCSVPRAYPGFSARTLDAVLSELDLLCERGARDIAFYDDALLFEPDKVLFPFLEKALERKPGVRYHTPNALHARLLTPEAARRMVQAGFKTFYLGFESSSPAWHRRTDGKVGSDEFGQSVENLLSAGADRRRITAYLLLAHPESGIQELEASMHFAHGLGIRLMLSDFSPIPGTPDGELCRRWVDMDEPLWHNKTAFPLVLLGEREVNRLKALCRQLNAGLG